MHDEQLRYVTVIGGSGFLGFREPASADQVQDFCDRFSQLVR